MSTPLLRIPSKDTDQVNWYDSLADYITHDYDEDPSQYKNEIEALSKLRNDMISILDHTDLHARDALLAYFGQLELLELHFPMEQLNVPLVFKWYDAFLEKPTTQHSIAFEKANVIFNIAALFSRLATNLPRDQKLVYHQFQLASGLFHYIQDHFMHPPSQDLSAEVLTWLSDLMLAQAQEVIYEKTMVEKKPKLAMKLVAGVAHLYSNLLNQFTSQKTLAKYFDGHSPVIGWLIQAKSKYFSAFAHYQKVSLMDPSQDINEMLTRLDIAKMDSKEAYQFIASKFTKVASSWEEVMHPLEPVTGFVDQAKWLHQQITELHLKLNKENDVIYHVQAMAKEALPPFETLILPEKLGFEQIFPTGITDFQSNLVDLFQKLIPMEIHEKNSLYSEKKSEVVRQVTALHQAFEQEYQSWLKQTDLNRKLEFYSQLSSSSYSSSSSSSSSSSNKNNTTKLDSSTPFSNEQANSQLQELWTTFSAVHKDVLDAVQKALTQVDHHVQAHPKLMETLPSLEVYKTIMQLKLKLEKQMNQYQSLYQSLSLPSSITNSFVATQGKKETLVENLLDTDPLPDFSSLLTLIQTQLTQLKELALDRQSSLNEFKAKVMHDDIHELLILNRKQNIDQHIFEVELTKFQSYLDPVHTNLKMARSVFLQCKKTWQQALSHPKCHELQVLKEQEQIKSKEAQERQTNLLVFQKNVTEYLHELMEEQSHWPVLKKTLEEWLESSVKSESQDRAQSDQLFLLQQLQRLQVTQPPPPSSTPPSSLFNLSVAPSVSNTIHPGYPSSVPSTSYYPPPVSSNFHPSNPSYLPSAPPSSSSSSSQSSSSSSPPYYSQITSTYPLPPPQSSYPTNTYISTAPSAPYPSNASSYPPLAHPSSAFYPPNLPPAFPSTTSTSTSAMYPPPPPPPSSSHFTAAYMYPSTASAPPPASSNASTAPNSAIYALHNAHRPS